MARTAGQYHGPAIVGSSQAPKATPTMNMMATRSQNLIVIFGAGRFPELPTMLAIGQGLAGPEGLIAAVIARAVDDVLGDGGPALVVDGLAYFGGPMYTHHVNLLGLPPDIRPAVLGQPDNLIRVIDLVLRGEDESETRPERA
jgi:hypothetical protein